MDHSRASETAARVNNQPIKGRPVLPPASLIICSRNRRVLLGETISSILKGSQLPDEIVVVDQSARPDADLSSIKPGGLCAIRYIWTKSVGAARARNEGMEAAKNEILAFVDDDMFADRDWFVELIASLVGSEMRTVVTGRVLPFETEAGDGFAPSLKTDEKPAVFRGRVGKDVLYTGNMAICRSTAKEVGGFDLRLGPGTFFPASEDNDLCFRLLEAGYSIRYVPEAVMYHRAWRSARDYVYLQFGYGLGQGAFYAKHYCWRDPYFAKRMLCDLRTYGRLCAQSLRGDRRRALGSGMRGLGTMLGALAWMIGGESSRT